MADLLIHNARALVTVDADRRELAGGWVSVNDGLIEAIGASTDPLP
ncbi:MAG: amidohydrolase, partial [Ilumatobacteraceae bacterium]|nr:amidohydrolase [Ilumatobacteraceae bacterium]